MSLRANAFTCRTAPLDFRGNPVSLVSSRRATAALHGCITEIGGNKDPIHGMVNGFLVKF